jgi:hypothetical protein
MHLFDVGEGRGGLEGVETGTEDACRGATRRECKSHPTKDAC